MKDIERIEHAQWVLERNISWIAQAEVKVAVVISLDVAIFSALAAWYTTATNKSAEAVVLTVLCGLVLLAAFACCFMVVKPRLGGPQSSYIFFGKITKKDITIFTEDFAKANAADFLADLTDQIHRNAEIAGEKHEWVRKAAMWSFGAIAFWVPAISLLSKV